MQGLGNVQGTQVTCCSSAHRQDMGVCRGSSGHITKELPSIAVVEGWPQGRTEHHIQPQLPPLGEEFRAVSLGGKAERVTDVSVGQWGRSMLTQRDRREKAFLDTTTTTTKLR